MCPYISFIPFLLLKFYSSRLILINSQSKVFPLLFVFLFYSQYFYHNGQIHYPLLQACIHKSKDKLFILKHYIHFLLQMQFLLLFVIVYCLPLNTSSTLNPRLFLNSSISPVLRLFTIFSAKSLRISLLNGCILVHLLIKIYSFIL